MKPTTTNRILLTLADGPAIACEVAAALGMPSGLTNSHLVSLHKIGRVTRRPFVKPEAARGGARRVWLYAPRGRRGVPA